MLPEKENIPAPNFSEVEIPPRILLGPGPSMVEARVLQAMSAPVVGHLDPAFQEIMDQTMARLRYVFQTENEKTFPISGTGTAAMEAAVANLVEPGDSVLCFVIGYFGDRLAEMARRYGAQVHVVSKPWGQVFTAEEVKAALEKHPAQIVTMVHGETSTGAAQPLEGMGEVIHQAGAVWIVDTVASLGGVPIFVDEMDIDVCYSGSQKCLSCPPGMGPITFGSRAWDKIAKRETPVANWYLDLNLLWEYWGPNRKYHHTAPISSVYAFNKALEIVAEEGLSNRWQRHQDQAEFFWRGLESRGIECHVHPEHRLASLTTVLIPTGVDDVETRKRLLSEYNIEISGGFGELAGKVWRVGLMGHSARRENVTLLLAALDQIIQR
ncbi:MAG: alanine--glyoxylate aminotransferase family protein [Anaerolineales bacterium]|jgi:alanine-glyoxylate transaminase/serine-glyoxylate transaminase/serine-pyruvate transaminase